MLETVETFIPYIIGPAGALLITTGLLIAVLWGLWTGVEKWVVPSIEAWMAHQRQHIEKLMQSHDEDRQAFRHAISSLAGHIGRVEQVVEQLNEDFNELKYELFDTKQ